MRPEIAPLLLNAAMTAFYLWPGNFEPGKALYWLGATILTVGVLLMRG